MHKNANESTAAMLEKLAYDMDAYANMLAGLEEKLEAANTQNNMNTKTASRRAAYGSLDDSKAQESASDRFTSWVIGG